MERKEYITNHPEIDISGFTSSEVQSIIYGGAPSPSHYCEMPLWIAKQIVEHKHFSRSLRDWANNEINAYIEA